jgi:antitoxin (DNA-binding transcriptional repressor) of toxin-antitoxin stability system
MCYRRGMSNPSAAETDWDDGDMSAGQDEYEGRAPAATQIGIRELRQHASIYVDLAEKGYTVDITNRGRLVAQLVPAKPNGPLERWIAAGIVEPADEPGSIVDLDPYPAASAEAMPAGAASPGATGAGAASASEALRRVREDEL